MADMTGAGRLLMVIFLLGVAAVMYYMLPLIQSAPSEELRMERIINAGAIIAMLIVLVIVMSRHSGLHQKIKWLESQRPPKCLEDLKKELVGFQSDLNALNIVFKDGLMSKKEYQHKKHFIDAEIRKKKSEIVNLEKSAKPGQDKPPRQDAKEQKPEARHEAKQEKPAPEPKKPEPAKEKPVTVKEPEKSEKKAVKKPAKKKQKPAKEPEPSQPPEENESKIILGTG
jgi:hypothetical protein